MPAKGTRRNKKATAEQILDVADTLFSQRGFAGVSARDIAEAAGVTKPLVFYHFGSKQTLFERVLIRYRERQTEALAPYIRAKGPIRERLHNALDAYVDFMEENHRYPALIQREVSQGSPPRIQEGQSMIYQWFVDALGELAQPEGALAARQFFVSTMGMVLAYFVMTPATEALWGADPLSPSFQRERREHLHWMLDNFIEGLSREQQARLRS